MRDSVLAGLAGLFVILGAGAAYFLGRGMREGRIARRLYFPFQKNLSLPDGREPGYAYRSHSPSLFWTEIAMQVLAVVVCIFMIFILVFAR